MEKSPIKLISTKSEDSNQNTTNLHSTKHSIPSNMETNEIDGFNSYLIKLE